MTYLVKMYNSGNSKAEIFGDCFEYESRKSSGVQIILSPATILRKICVSYFKDAEYRIYHMYSDRQA